MIAPKLSFTAAPSGSDARRRKLLTVRLATILLFLLLIVFWFERLAVHRAVGAGGASQRRSSTVNPMATFNRGDYPQPLSRTTRRPARPCKSRASRVQTPPAGPPLGLPMSYRPPPVPPGGSQRHATCVRSKPRAICLPRLICPEAGCWWILPRPASARGIRAFPRKRASLWRRNLGNRGGRQMARGLLSEARGLPLASTGGHGYGDRRTIGLARSGPAGGV